MSQDRSPDQQVVVTGVGIACPVGIDLEDAWTRCISADSGIGPCTRFDTSGHRCQAAALVPSYELQNLRAPKNQKFLNAGARHLLLASQRALMSSGLSLPASDPSRVALHVGSGRVGPEPSEFFRAFEVAHIDDGAPDWDQLGGRASRLVDPYFPLRTLSNSGAALLAMEICARGPSSNFVQSDVASALALDAACHDLTARRCDIAIAGGFDCLVTPESYLTFEKQGLLSGKPSSHALQPFDRDADGIVLGEGAAALVLERLSDARSRSAPILGEIAGFATSAAAGHAIEPFPARDAVARSLSKALNGRPVDFAVASGFGLPDCDRKEAAILAELLRQELPVTAFKGLTGYLGAATALVEIALGIMALRNAVVPPIAHLARPAEGVSINLATSPIHLDRASDRSAVFLTASWTGQSAAVYVKTVPD